MKCYYCVAKSNDETPRKVFNTFESAADYIVCELMVDDELPGDYDDIWEHCDAEGWSHIALPMGIVEIWADDETECFHRAI